MLKIKDNVDLKELEKFGFKIDADSDWYYYDIDRRTNLCIKPICRQVIFKVYNDTTRIMDNINILYDLIKADLVEKVEDKKCIQ